MIPMMYRICILHHGYHFDEKKKKNMKREEQRSVDINVYHSIPITCLDEQSSMTYPNSGLFVCLFYF
jgi:hypothetical protein